MISNNPYTIAFSGLANSEYDFDFNVGNDFFAEFLQSELKTGDCEVEVHLTKHSNFLELDINIEGSVEVECDRCLEILSLPVQFNSLLVVKFSDDIQEPEIEINDTQEDTLWICSQDKTLDLKQYIYDSINLALPISRIHPDDENGTSLCNPDMLSRIISE